MIRQILFYLVVIFSSTQAFGQSYSYEKIVGTADSIVKANLDPKLLRYFSRDSGDIKYEFKLDNRRKTRYSTIGKGETTRGHFKRTHLFYGFRYKEPKINDSLTPGFLSGDIYLVFDANLHQTEEVDLSFIPRYVREQRPCDFITMESAVELAKLDQIKNGLEPLTATLSYNGNLKNYSWRVISLLKKEHYRNSIRVEADTVTIDAVTGKIISHEITYFGPMH